MTDIVKQARKLIILRRELDIIRGQRFNKILAEKMAVAVIEANQEYEETEGQHGKEAQGIRAI